MVVEVKSVLESKFIAFLDILAFKNIVNRFENPEDLGREMRLNFNMALAAALNNDAVTVDLTSDKIVEVKK